MEEVVAIVAMFVLRLGVPVAITLAIGYGLRRLDARWEAEALAQHLREEIPTEIQGLKKPEHPCWEIKGCPEEDRAVCPACEFWDIPCWAARLRATGRIYTRCQSCELFAVSAAA